MSIVSSQTYGQDSLSKNDRLLDVFPAFFNVAGRRVVIAGGGDEAAAKLRLLSETSARLEVVAQTISQSMKDAISATSAAYTKKIPEFEDFADAALVFTAQESEDADRLTVEAARLAGVPVNAVDRPHLCDFITPAIVNRAPVVVAISTSGTAPVFARRIKALLKKCCTHVLAGLPILPIPSEQRWPNMFATAACAGCIGSSFLMANPQNWRLPVTCRLPALQPATF